tara:strand:+ start:3718 stop:4098 length:381 start_codon:yes stop_codon:yes gene_type:complete
MKSKFEEKFNVGDKISYHKSPEDIVEILSFKGSTAGCFTGFNEDSDVSGKFTKTAENWKLYKEPVKKDLEGFTNYYTHLRINLVETVSKNAFKEISDAHRYWNNTTFNVLGIYTKEEAIERGLKID